MTIFKVIRWKNLVMIATVQALIHYHLMAVFKLESSLNHLDFILIILASVLIAAGGYIINDIYDLEADKINKPENVWIPNLLTLKNAKFLYYSFSIIGLLLGLIVVLNTDNIIGILWFILPIILLFLYAKWIKKILFLGNLLVASLIAFSLLLVVLFERIDFSVQRSISITFLDTILGLLVFAFLLNLVREIVKDAQDVMGDKVIGVQSIPIRFGKELTHIIIQAIVGLLSGFIIVIAIRYYETQIALIVYLITAVLVGLILFLSQLNKVRNPSDYDKLSSLLKLLMLAGLFSMFFVQYQI